MTRQQILFRCFILLEFEELENRSLIGTICESMEILGFTNYLSHNISESFVLKIFPMLREWDYKIRDMKFKKSVLKSMYWRCGTDEKYKKKIPKSLEKFKYKPEPIGEDFI